MSQSSAPFGGGTAATKRWVSKGLLAIVDQGLIAASNFILAVLLARQIGAAEYGAWAVAFEIFLLIAVVHSSFVLEPMSVFGPSNYKNCTREYLGTLLRLHGWVAAATVLVLSTTAWTLHAMRAETLATAMTGVALATPCVLLFWTVRRSFYIEFNPAGAVWGAAVYSSVLLIGLAACYKLQLLSPFTAFLLMGLAGLVTTAGLLIRIKFESPIASTGPAAHDVLRRHWDYGRWALASSAASWGTVAILYFLLTSFHGLAATGQLKALLNVTSPIGTAFVAISLLSVPYGSSIRNSQTPDAMLQFAGRLTGFYMLGTAAYFLAVSLLSHPVVHLLYGNKYLETAQLIPWIGAGMVLRIGATAQAASLRALQSPSLVFAAYGASFLVGAGIGVPATWAYGLRGTVAAFVIASGSAILFASWLLRRKLQQSEEPAGEFQPA